MFAKHLRLKKLALIGVTGALVLAAGVAAAQTKFAIGSIIRGFELPQNGPDGRLQSRIRGREAIVISDSQIRIHGLEIEIFRENNANIKILSDESVYWTKEGRLTTDKMIEIDRPGMKIRAKGMVWEMAEAKGVLQDDVKVTVQSGSFQIEP